MAINKRTSKTITRNEDIEYLIGLTEHDITMSLIMELFGDFGKYQRFNPYDIITIPVGGYGGEPWRKIHPVRSYRTYDNDEIQYFDGH